MPLTQGCHEKNRKGRKALPSLHWRQFVRTRDRPTGHAETCTSVQRWAGWGFRPGCLPNSAWIQTDKAFLEYDSVWKAKKMWWVFNALLGVFKLSYNENGDVPEKLSIEKKAIWLKSHYVFLWPALDNWRCLQNRNRPLPYGGGGRGGGNTLGWGNMSDCIETEERCHSLVKDYITVTHKAPAVPVSPSENQSFWLPVTRVIVPNWSELVSILQILWCFFLVENSEPALLFPQCLSLPIVQSLCPCKSHLKTIYGAWHKFSLLPNRFNRSFHLQSLIQFPDLPA